MYRTKPITIIMAIGTSPYYFVTKIFFTENIIQYKFNVCTNVPIYMNEYVASFRQ